MRRHPDCFMIKKCYGDRQTKTFKKFIDRSKSPQSQCRHFTMRNKFFKSKNLSVLFTNGWIITDGYATQNKLRKPSRPSGLGPTGQARLAWRIPDRPVWPGSNRTGPSGLGPTGQARLAWGQPDRPVWPGANRTGSLTGENFRQRHSEMGIKNTNKLS